MKNTPLINKSILAAVVVTLSVTLGSTAHAQSNARGQEMKTQNSAAKEQKDLMKRTGKASESAVRKKTAHIKNADLTAMTGTTLTVTKDGKTYTIVTTAATKLRKHFGGATTLAEFSVGDKLDIAGQWTDTTETSLTARSIRNRSEVKFRRVLFGSVLSKSGSTLVISTKNKGNQTITLSTATRYINRSQKVITVNDISVGNRIRVRGMWDKAANTVTQVTQIKNFSLPAQQSSGSATPTITATDSATTNL